MSAPSYEEKPTYRSELIKALRILGGQGKLNDIYQVIEDRNILPAITTNVNWRAQVRKQLQRDSSDTKLNESGKDIFYSVNGLHEGVWGIRELSLLDSDETYDFYSNGEFNDKTLREGANKIITVNAYERNRKLRQKCIEYFGLNCIICSFNFEQLYGFRGYGFIEVHHIVPLSEIGKSYLASPKDLRPVCSNCHSMIHRYKPFLSIEEMRDLIEIVKCN